MKQPELKKGDRVIVVAPENELLKYEGLKQATGTIIRFRKGKVRVEIDNTGSQDSEGYNSYTDVEYDQVMLMEKKNNANISR